MTDEELAQYRQEKEDFRAREGVLPDNYIGVAERARIAEYRTKQQQELEQYQKIKANFYLREGFSPDEYARQRQTARNLGLPQQAVIDAPEDARIRELAQWAIAKSEHAPIIRDKLTLVDFNALAHDDVEPMSNLERKMKSLGAGITQGVGGTLSGVGKLDEMLARYSGTFSIENGRFVWKSGADGYQSSLSKIGGVVEGYSTDYYGIPEDQHTFSDKVTQGLGQLIPLLVTGGAGRFAQGVSMYAQGVDQVGDMVEHDNASQGKKDLAMLLGGSLTAVTERFALDRMTGGLFSKGVASLASRAGAVAIGAASEGVQETLENIGQDYIKQQLTDPNHKVRIAEALEAGGVGVGVGAVVTSLIESAAHIRVRQQQRAEQVKTDAAVKQEIDQAAQESKLAGRDPDLFRQTVDDIAREAGAEHFYVDAAALQQSGLAEGLIQASESVAAQYAEAVASGGTIQIPVAEYVANVATQPELAGGLDELVRFTPDGDSLAEAKAFAENGDEKLDAQLRDLAEKAVKEAGEAVEADAVYKEVYDNLKAVGRFDDAASQQQAKMAAAIVRTQAQRLGITPAEYWERYGRFDVRGEALDGNALLSGSAMKDSAVNVRRGQEAMNKALLDKADQHRAMYRNDIGWIDFVWGDVGKVLPNGKTRGGMGLAHILEARMRKDGMSRDSVVKMLTQDIVATIGKGTVSDQFELNGSTNLKIDHNGYRATLAKNKGSNAWMVTAFELYEGANSKDYGKPIPTEHQSYSARTDAGASYTASDSKHTVSDTNRVNDTHSHSQGGRAVVADSDSTLPTPNAEVNTKEGVPPYMARYIGKIQERLDEAVGKDLAQRLEIVGFSEAQRQAGDKNLLTAGVEGFYRPSTDKIVLVAENLSPDRVPWVAWHELAHRGVAVQFAGDYFKVIRQSYKNGTVGKLADAIAQEYLKNDGKEISKDVATEEALAELFAAYKTNNLKALQQRYGVDVSGMKNIGSYLEKVADRLRTLFAQILNRPRESFSDEDVFALIGALDESVQAMAQEGNQESGVGNQESGKAQFSLRENDSSFDTTATQYGGQEAYDQAKADGQTKLNYRQWVQVRTPEFKEWFGDWEYDPANASKVVDEETGEPLVVYHGTNADFSVFESKPGSDVGFHFGSMDAAHTRLDKKPSHKASVMEVMLRAQHPFNMPDPGRWDNHFDLARALKGTPLADAWQQQYATINDLENKLIDAGELNDEQVVKQIQDKTADLFVQTLRAQGFDGVRYVNQYEGGGVSWMVLEPSQIKSATGNTGAFDAQNDDIRFSRQATEQNTARWKKAIKRYSSNNPDYSPYFEAPSVIRRFGAGNRISLPYRVARRIADKHRDIPDFIFENLPTVLSEPRFVFTHKDGGVNVVLKETTEVGEPIVVGIRDNRIRTITPYNNSEEFSGEERLQHHLTKALSQIGEVYAENSDALNESRASNLAQVGLFPKGANRVKASVITHDDIVKQYGDSFLQDTGNIRGAYDPTTRTIALTKNADLSTFQHEMGHHFLEVTFDVAAQLKTKALEELTESERQVLTDAETVLKWLGVADVETWQAMSLEEKRSYHEQYAQGFEVYLFEGKAPNPELRTVFARLKAWMVSVYKTLTALNVELTDDVRAVFDRLVATDSQIAQAEADRNLSALFEDADTAGMSAEEFAEYQKDQQAAADSAREKLGVKAVNDLKWLSGAKERRLKALQDKARAKRDEMRGEVEEVLTRRPLYRAWKWLQDGELWEERDGTRDTMGRYTKWGEGETQRDVKATAGYKLDIKSLQDAYPADVVKRMQQLKLTQEGGLAPDLVADIFGYASGDEMVREIAASPTFNEAVGVLTDYTMVQRYGELATPEAMREAADAAVFDELRIKVLRTEYNAMARALGKPSILAKAAKEYAEKTISAIPLKDLKPAAYRRMAAKAGRAADAAMKKGDTATAAAEKRNQVLQATLAEVAQNTLDNAAKIRTQWQKWGALTLSRYAKNYDEGMVEAVKTVVGLYGIASKKGEKAAEYMDRFRKYEPEKFAAVDDLIRRATLDTNARGQHKRLNDLSSSELTALHDELKSLMTYSRRSKQVEVEGKKIDTKVVVAELKAISTTRETKVGGNLDATASAAEKGLRAFASAKAALRRVEGWCRAMDGKQGDAFTKYIFQPVKQAANKYRLDQIKYLERYKNIMKPMAADIKRGAIAAPEIGFTFRNSGELMHAILHTGNASNKRKLLLGYKWGVELKDGSVDTSRWDALVQRLIKEGRLTRQHFDTVQQVWDLFEEMKPAAQKTFKERYGHYFEEITADPFSTPFGEYRGGYIPAAPDLNRNIDSKLLELTDLEKGNMDFAFPSTSKGFTKSRVEHNVPLALDLNLLTGHIDKVLIFTHMEMPVQDANRILREMTAEIDRVSPEAVNGMLKPWLAAAAQQRMTQPFENHRWLGNMLNWARNRAGVIAMMGNIPNAVQQMAGFLPAAVHVKPKYILDAYAQRIGSKDFVEKITEASPYMAVRLNNQAMAMQGSINQILVAPNALQKLNNWVNQHAYFAQEFVDNLMSPAIWFGAYTQEIEKGKTHNEAVAFADFVIRDTQGSSLVEDVAAFERGNPFVRMFTQFTGWINSMANLMGTEYQIIQRDVGLRQGAGRLLYVGLMGFYLNAIVAEAIVLTLRGGPGDDDDDGEYLDDWLMALFLRAPVQQGAAMIPYAGTPAANMFLDSSPYNDRMMASPATNMIEGAVRAIKHGDYSGDNPSKNIKDGGALLAATVFAPAARLSRSAAYAYDVSEGDIIPTGGVDYMRGLLTGTASPESRQ